MATPNQQFTDTERFIQKLNNHHRVPTWHDAAGMGAELIDFDREHTLLQERINEGHTYLATHDELDNDAVRAFDERLRALEPRLAELAAQPGRYHLATGETIQLDPATGQAYRSGWWFDDNAIAVTTPNGQRFHHPGTHDDAVIDPAAQIDPTARIEPSATIGAHTRIGPYAHIGRGANIDTHCIIRDGTWIGPGSELWSRIWVNPGATIGAHSVIGTRTTIGAGAHITQHSQIEPLSRLGTGTTTANTNKPRNQRSVQIAGAIDHLMRLDRD